MDQQEIRRRNLAKVKEVDFAGHQARMASVAGCAPSTLSRILHGKRVEDVIRVWEKNLGYQVGALDRLDFAPTDDFRIGKGCIDTRNLAATNQTDLNVRLLGDDTSSPLRQGSDVLPFDGMGLNGQQRALLGIFERLTSSQKEAFIRELEEVKRKNEEIVKELTRSKDTAGNGS